MIYLDQGWSQAVREQYYQISQGSTVISYDIFLNLRFDDRAELLAAAPDVYYVTDHYLNYTSVLVRLSRVTPDVLRDLLGMAHKFVSARRADETDDEGQGPGHSAAVRPPGLPRLRSRTSHSLWPTARISWAFRMRLRIHDLSEQNVIALFAFRLSAIFGSGMELAVRSCTRCRLVSALILLSFRPFDRRSVMLQQAKTHLGESVFGIALGQRDPCGGGLALARPILLASKDDV